MSALGPVAGLHFPLSFADLCDRWCDSGTYVELFLATSHHARGCGGCRGCAIRSVKFQRALEPQGPHAGFNLLVTRLRSPSPLDLRMKHIALVILCALALAAAVVCGQEASDGTFEAGNYFVNLNYPKFSLHAKFKNGSVYNEQYIHLSLDAGTVILYCSKENSTILTLPIFTHCLPPQSKKEPLK